MLMLSGVCKMDKIRFLTILVLMMALMSLTGCAVPLQQENRASAGSSASGGTAPADVTGTETAAAAGATPPDVRPI
jgi:uncharacterized lipoprotein YajG